MAKNRKEEGGGASLTTAPAAGESTATDVSIREFLAKAIHDLDRYLSAEISRVEDALAAEVELRRARREDDLRAIEKAEQQMSLRLDAMNEIREQLREQASTFVTVAEFRAEIDKVESLMERNRADIDGLKQTFLPRETYDASMTQWAEWRATIDRTLSITAGERQGSQLTKGTLVTIISISVAVIGLIVVLANYFASK